MSRILFAIMGKEFRHIFRDPQTLLIILALPLAMLFLFSYAITMEMREIPLVINDQSHSEISRRLVQGLQASGFFRVTEQDLPESAYDQRIRTRSTRAVLTIPFDLEARIGSGQVVPLQLIIDASDPNAAQYILNYTTQSVELFNQQQGWSQNSMFPQVVPRFLYNAELKSSNFFVPGLAAIILLLISALLTSLAIVREKELGSMEQLLVSPVRPFELVVGKVLPYLFLGFTDGLLVLAAAVFWFQVPMNGPLWQLLVAMLLYILTGLSIGLLISTRTRSQRAAISIALMSTILPTILLSGFIFPVSSMPEVLQYLSKIIPATHFLIIIRSLMLKGVGMETMWVQTFWLASLALLLLAVSIRKFNTDLEG